MRSIVIRIVISLIIGGAITEILFLTTGDSNRPRNEHADSTITLVSACIAFAVLTLIANIKARKQK
jgi:hypothetical protein